MDTVYSVTFAFKYHVQIVLVLLAFSLTMLSSNYHYVHMKHFR